MTLTDAFAGRNVNYDTSNNNPLASPKGNGMKVRHASYATTHEFSYYNQYWCTDIDPEESALKMGISAIATLTVAIVYAFI